MPGSTPSSATPRNAVDRQQELGACAAATAARSRARRPGDSDAAITTAASGGLGQVAQQARDRAPIIRMISRGPDDARPAGIFAPDRSATAVRDPLVLTGNPWNSAGGQVRRADADHLAVAADLLPGARRERRRGGDRVGQGDQARSPERRRTAAPDRPGLDRRRRCVAGNPWESVPTSRHTMLSQAQHGLVARDRGDDPATRIAGTPRQPTPEGENHGQPLNAPDRDSSADSFAVGEPRARTREPRRSSRPRRSRSPQSLGSCPNEDRQREAVHIADLRRF